MKRNLIALIVLGVFLAQCNSDQLRVEEGYKEINGVSHYYKLVGEGEPYIILHGGPGMYHDELFPFFLDFASTNKVVFYDQRGNGKSILKKIDSTTFNVELMVEDLEELRKEFGIEKINIIGHSWGGLLAMYYGVKYPENLKRLILVDAAPVNSELLIASYKKQISMFKPEEWERVQKLWESEEYLEGDPDVHNEAMRISEGTVFSNKSVIDNYMEVASFDEITAKNAVALNDLATQMKLDIHVQDKLLKIKCPTLLINGKDDFIVEEAVQLANRLIVNSEVIYIENAGHYPYIENKKDFFDALNGFIERTKHINVYTK